MSQNEIPEKMIFCSECGAQNLNNAKFCSECGMKIDNKLFDDLSFNVENNSSVEKSLELTPAESYLILYLDSANLSTDNAQGKELLKLTMKDLLARKVLKIDSREEKRFLSTKIVQKIGKGENFNTDFKPHEEIFTVPLSKNPVEIKKYFKKLLKQFRSRLTGPSFFKYKTDLVMPILIEKGYVILVKKKSMISPAKYGLTEEGMQVKNKINYVFKDSDNLFQWADSNPEKAKAFLSAVGTHIFILPYDREQLLSLKNRLANVKTKTSKFYPYLLYPVSFWIGMKMGGRNVLKKKEDLYDYDDSIDLFDMDVFDVLDDWGFDSFDNVFDSFDNVCDSFEGGDNDGFDW